MSFLASILTHGICLAQGAGPKFLPHDWPEQMDLFNICNKMGPVSSIVVIGIGVVFLMWGYNYHKMLVTLNAAVVGTVVGFLIGKKLGGPMPGAILGGFCCAAVAWPLMKWSVAVMGGLCGAIIGGSIWQASGLDSQFVWAGAMMGLIACGLICFIIFRASIMTYTSLQGACMIVIGVLALALKYDNVGPAITRNLEVKPFLLPIAVFIPTILGLMYQQSTAPAGGGGGGGGGNGGGGGGAPAGKK